jgi:hypothetical protein
VEVPIPEIPLDAVASEPPHSDDGGFHLDRGDKTDQKSVFDGPPLGLRAWVDWLIEIHRRWHEGDPPPKPGWRVLFGTVGWLLVLAGIVEKIVGG